MLLKFKSVKIGEILVQEIGVEPKDVAKGLEIQKAQKKHQDETIRVASSKIDGLIQLVGELSIQLSMLDHARETGTLDSDQAQHSFTLGMKLTKQLQKQTLTLRMSTLEKVYQRFERILRDTARKVSKEINIEFLGELVELDKGITEHIVDPLIHVLRNCVDHGIESTDERKKATNRKKG